MTLDQRASREGSDAVPGLLAALSGVPVVREFTRTVGDEVQGVLDDGRAVADAVRRAAVLGGWHIGIGIGEVESPLPDSAVAGRGPAFYAARNAVEAAKTAPAHLVVAAGEDAEEGLHSGFAQTALRLLVTALAELGDRARGYVDFRLDHPDASQARIAADFDVTQQAVSRVLSQGGVELVAGARDLARHHLDRADRAGGASGAGGADVG